MSFSELCQARRELFAQDAARWEAFGVTLGKRHDELARLIGTVGTGWEGVARDAAIAYLTRIAERIEGDLALVEQIPPVLDDHSATVAAAQRLARGAVAAAQGTPITVGPDGSVGIAPQTAALALLTSPALLAVLVGLGKMIAEAIGQALDIATESDTRTATQLTDLTPGLGGGVVTGESGPGSPRIPPAGTSPQQVNQWWDGLSPAEQQTLIHTRPQAIGNLDGIPAQARDQANRLVLQAQPDHSTRIAELDRLGAQRSAAQTTELERLRGIETIRDRLASAQPRQAYLLGFDPAGNGKAIVAVGNPDTADNVVTYVPGAGAGLHSVPTDLRRADLMVKEANMLDPGSATSAVMWIGYQAPQDIATFPPGCGDAIDPEFAQRAGPSLDSFQDGLRATHEGPPSHNTVLGHSYGSTVIGHAAKDHGLAIDDVIFVGSPGVGVEHASELGLEPGQVWSSHAANDPIQLGLDPGSVLGRPLTLQPPAPELIHGRNPSDPDFGGRTFTSDPGTPVVTANPGSWYAPWETEIRFSMDAHSQYWDPHTASLDNITAIITDKDELVY
ncbi:MAG: alpha/beta hydrolase [Pseudonocardiaceae bacterium]